MQIPYMIKGLFETHLEVTSIERSIAFYTDSLGLTLAHRDPLRKAAFFWVSKPQEAMLGIWESKQPVSSRHIAFRCTVEDVLLHAETFLKRLDLKPYNFLQDGTARPMVFAWMPALSLYFRDPDMHELEFIATLEGEGRPELGILSYEEWKATEQFPRIEKLQPNAALPMPILLLADETIEAIERYIYQCDVYILLCRDRRAAGAFALHRNSPEEIEIKNLAVIEADRGKGLGTYMLSAIHRIAAESGCRKIVVGTATVGRQLNFYIKNGFSPFEIRKNFFVENYPDPIIEDGERLCDMVLLEKRIEHAN